MHRVSPPISFEPCYAASCVAPLLELSQVTPAQTGVDRGREGSRRIPVRDVHERVQAAERALADSELGLKASARLTVSQESLLYFVMASAATPRAALRVGARYLRLCSDVHALTESVQGGLATVSLSCRVEVPRAMEVFALASIVRGLPWYWPAGMMEQAEVHFRCTAPKDDAPYRSAFAGARVCFDAELSGLRFPASWLDVTLPAADARLHALLVRFADEALDAIGSTDTVTKRVRARAREQLQSPIVTLDEMAEQLRMSSRTLIRRLAAEGTTFTAVLEELQRSAALEQVANTDRPIKDIATLTGFTCPPSFHRAFRRWTQQTPVEYRQGRNGKRTA